MANNASGAGGGGGAGASGVFFVAAAEPVALRPRRAPATARLPSIFRRVGAAVGWLIPESSKERSSGIWLLLNESAISLQDRPRGAQRLDGHGCAASKDSPI